MNVGDLAQRQSLPLEAKVILTQQRIRQWHDAWDGEVYISFSGGKDSTVLLHLVRELFPDVPAVFIDTGLEYPEIRDFVKTIDNVVWIKPELSFKQVIDKYGYPVVSKEQSSYIEEYRHSNSEKLKYKRLHGVNGSGKISSKWQYLIDAPFKISDKCCDYLKKKPVHQYEKETGRKPYIGVMASDSRQRTQQYVRAGGCNAFDAKRPISKPLSIWLEQDIWDYIRMNGLPYSKIYDMGYNRTGCMFCMFGCHLEPEPNKFQVMQNTHPKMYNYCIDKLELGKVMDYLKVNYK